MSGAAASTVPVGTATPVGGAAAPPPIVSIGSSGDFSAAVLEELGIPVTPGAVAALNAWQQAEGQWHATGDWNPSVNHNPLNLEGNTRGHPNPATGIHYASPTNPINIYGDWTTGVQETALRIAANPGIVAMLKSTSVTPAALSAAVSASGWGTGPFGGASTASVAGSGGSQTATLDVSIGQLPGDIAAAGAGLIPGLGGAEAGIGTLQAIGGSLSSVTDFLKLFLTKRFWMGALGVAFIVGGGAIFVASTKPGQEAMDLAPAALLAAA